MATVIFTIIGMVILVVLGYVVGVNHTLDFLFKHNLIDEELYEYVTGKTRSDD